MTGPHELILGCEGRRAKAVVAEDEPVIRLEMVDFLGDEGFEVHDANDAAGAMVHLERLGGVDLLFTDVRLPGPRDGLALAREVSTRWPDTRIVVCSAFPRPTDDAIPSGAWFFAKPLPTWLVRKALR